MELADNDKRCSLLWLLIDYICKKFFSAGHWLSVSLKRSDESGDYRSISSSTNETEENDRSSKLVRFIRQLRYWLEWRISIINLVNTLEFCTLTFSARRISVELFRTFPALPEPARYPFISKAHFSLCIN